MGLTKFALTRPVTVTMGFLALVLIGAISYRLLNQELFPSINSPVVTIITLYSGAAPEDVERQITKPIEDAVSGLSNIDYIQSTSSEGRSSVVVFFLDKANSDLVTNDVERRVSSIRALLPTDAGQPTVAKFDFTAQPVLFISLAGDRPLQDIFKVADDEIRQRLQALDGVGQVSIIGGVAREIQVQIDPKRLQAYNLTFDQVAASLQRENQSRPGGLIDQGNRTLNVRLSGLFTSTDDVRKLVVSSGSGAPVTIGDLGQVVDTTQKVATMARFNGRTAVAITVAKAATANEVKTADAVKAELDKIRHELPEGLEITVVSDSSKFTRSSLDGVQHSLLEAVLLTALVLLFFLHTMRATVIVLFAIPTSLLTTLLWMNLLGFTLNVMSTLALVLVIGVLVDDSIVVIENIMRHLELGEPPWQAALNGRSEIGMAAIAITMVDVVIFLPVGFLTGTTGGFFKQFGLVIVAAVLTSLLVSFTLTPMLASRWLNRDSVVAKTGPWGRFVAGWNRGFEWLEGAYQHVLRSVLGKWTRFLPPIVAILSLVASFALVPLGYVKFEFVPTADNGMFSITTELPAGSSLQATSQLIEQIEKRLAQVPEVDMYLSFIGTQTLSALPRYGQVFVVLHDVKERKRDVFEVMASLAPDLEGLDGATVRINASGFNAGTPVEVRVQGQNRKDVEGVASQVEALVRRTPGTQSVTNSASVGNPEFRLVVDRDRLADYRLTADQAAAALRMTVDGIVATKLRPANANEVDIRLISDPAARRSVEDLANIPLVVVRDGLPVSVRLGQVTKLAEVPGPTSLVRRNRVPQATIAAALVGQTALNDVTGPVARQVDQLQSSLPPGVTVTMGGQAQAQAEAFGQLLFALGLSIVLTYMLMAALYESFILPFATMFALPVATVGAFIGLAVSHNTLNLLSLIGFIVLMGLVGKNGILLVDYTNTLRQRGRSRTEALLEAGPTRLRPILMTTSALVFGLFPIAARLEEGSIIYASIGALVIGGMLSSTLLSLVVVPTMYTFFDDFQIALGKVFKWRRGKRLEPESEPATGPRDSASTPVAGRPAMTAEAD